MAWGSGVASLHRLRAARLRVCVWESMCMSCVNVVELRLENARNELTCRLSLLLSVLTPSPPSLPPLPSLPPPSVPKGQRGYFQVPHQAEQEPGQAPQARLRREARVWREGGREGWREGGRESGL